MKNKMIFMAMALMLYAIAGLGQLPTAVKGLGDFVIKTSTWDQTEPTISIDKGASNNLLVSFNTMFHTDGDEGQGYYFSNDSGHTWSGFDNMPNSAWSYGDPSTTYDANGLGYMTGLNTSEDGYFLVSTSTHGVNWSSPTIYVEADFLGDVDKEMAIADDLSSSPFANRYYCAWLDLNNGKLKTQWSDDQGSTWHDTLTIKSPAGLGAAGSGINIQTGPNGEVYMCWDDYTSTGNQPGQNIGFAFSAATYGGSSYATSIAFPDNALGTHGNNGDSHFGNTRVNGFPSMTVDKSCGPNHGRIYITYAEYLPGTSNSVINMRFSDNNGTTWTPSSTSSAIQISPSNLDQAWFPCASVDDLTGVVSVVYYGYQGAQYNTNTYVSFSDPTDVTSTTWDTIVVSSGSQTPYPEEFTTATQFYNGDYIGITSYGNHAYAVWSDRRSGLRQIWMARVDYNARTISSSQTSLQVCTPSLTGKSNFQAGDDIAVANCGSDVSVGATANVNITAGQNIIFHQGFSTQPGAVFTAEIQSTSCQTPGVASFKTNSSNQWSSDSSIIKREVSGMKVYAYPNPAIDIITVGALNNNYQRVSFIVSDISGRFIAQYDNPSISSGDIRQAIDVSSYASGLYLVTMKADNQNYSFKFAKE